jgi:hypothetical protein
MQSSAAAETIALDHDTLAICRRGDGDAGVLLAIVRLRGQGAVELSGFDTIPSRDWSVVLTTEDAGFTEGEVETVAQRIFVDAGGSRVTFRGPAAVVLVSP